MLVEENGQVAHLAQWAARQSHDLKNMVKLK